MSDAIRTNRMRCRVAVVSCSLLSFLVFLAVCDQLLSTPDAIVQEVGWKSYHMFTILANMFAGIAAALCIPYAVDGLRYDNYHLPRWVVNVLYMATTGVALTFLISLFILAPVKGFVLIFTGSRFFLHGVCPLLAIAAFCFFMSEKRLTIGQSLFALIPVAIYATVYYIMVAVVGEDKGGWNDFYGFLTRIPSWISLSAIMPLTFGIATGIRVLHNRAYDRRKKEEAECFSALFADADVRKTVASMARSNSSAKILDIVIPSRVITIMLEYSHSDATLEECCEIYLKEYMENSAVLNMEKFWI